MLDREDRIMKKLLNVAQCPSAHLQGLSFQLSFQGGKLDLQDCITSGPQKQGSFKPSPRFKTNLKIRIDLGNGLTISKHQMHRD
jgi:hypothetical protein